MSLSRLGPVCGIAFVPLYMAAVLVPDLPESGYSDARVLALYDDPSPYLISAALMAAAGVAFLVFLTDLRRRLDGDPLARLAFGGGLLYVAALFLAGTFWAGYALGGGGPFDSPPSPAEDVLLARILTHMGIGVLLLYGLVSAAVLVVAASVAGRRTAALPRWLAVTGLVITPLLLAGVTWFPQVLVPLWVLAVSAHALRRMPRAEETAAPVPVASGR